MDEFPFLLTGTIPPTTNQLEGSYGCGFDYLEVYDGDSANTTKLGRFCGNQLPRSLVSSGLKLFIVFHSDYSVSAPGFVLNYSTPLDVNECYFGTHNCAIGASCVNTNESFYCICENGYTGDGVTCTDINECELGIDNCHSQASCRNTNGSFDCSCNFGFSGDGIACNATRPSNTSNPGTIPPTTNPAKNIPRNFTTSAPELCGESQLYPPGKLTSPLHPLSYPHYLDCSWTISSTNGRKILLQFTSFLLEGSYSCGFDYLEVYDGDSANTTKLGRFCGNQLPRSLVSSGLKLFIVFHSDYSVSAPGFVLNYSTPLDVNECYFGTHNCAIGASCVNTNESFYCICENGYTGDGVTCTDINECELGIDNCHSQASCRNTNGSFDCSCNFGFSGDGIACNATRPSNTSNPGTIPPTTNPAKNIPRNFTTSAPELCGESQLYPPGKLTSPLYPLSYPHYLDCSWTISSTNGRKILLQFTSFLLEGSYSCGFDYLEVYDGDSANTTKLGRFCGNQLPRSLVSSGLKLFIVFHSDYSVSAPGFVLNYSTPLDVNECYFGTHNCAIGASCVNTNESFYCICENGYTGDGVTCTDINECELGIDNCHSQASCRNTNGSFDCSCNFGFSGDGIACNATRPSNTSNPGTIPPTTNPAKNIPRNFTTSAPELCGESQLYPPGKLTSPLIPFHTLTTWIAVGPFPAPMEEKFYYSLLHSW
ncbi:bone morphogenetic protein 1-like [Dendronephthya gigantea]|uniref:bone morphogenetic protein 1-like n=1 Tax=Dendronephthya gigantea TaxID=151771 RepID=UPI001069A815|nr:bone morphogenetic protein 1-like [Dendronephthya gigantea]